MITIDPGHNSRANLQTEPIGPGSRTRKIKDGGGTYGRTTGTPEHVVTLGVGLHLRKLLKREGYCVTMTRTRGGGLSKGNVSRARVANRARAKLFLRIHADGSTDSSTHGSSTLYPAFRRGWTDDILPASKRAARLIQGRLWRGLDSKNLGIIRRSDLTGFNWADVPAVLVELGFMTNPGEDRKLSRASYQRRSARALLRGIERFTGPR
jgi:N-acetylmuramoyl-L-alanine amidase